jgi:hypothetical protein
MKMPNLGIVVPIAAATGIGLLRARQLRWPWRRAQEETPSSLAQLVILTVIPQAQLNRTRPYSPETTPNLTWPDPTQP